MPSTRQAPVAAGRFGTFGGVFTPCTLTILGVIMFLRFGHVVGQAGLWHALLIVLAAKTITTLTTLSLSAVATNTKVQGGGAYFLISRSLGVESGGAIGVVFFVAQAVSVAMYVIGFVEALTGTFPSITMDPRVLGTIVNVIVAMCVFIGAGWTIKLQYGILAILGLSLVSFFIGAALHADAELLAANLQPQYLPGHGFFTMFALFFPAATGIMAGANMSGDLKDPAKSIPSGTLGSVAVTGVVYVVIAIGLAACGDRALLLENPLAMQELSWVPALIVAGVFAATISSALGSMMGAPRILQALAKDGVFERLAPFAVGAGATGEPRRAVVVTFVLAQGAVMLGDLNLIAPIITMFFMITYGYLNLATFRESVTANPSYRPSFRLSHWSTALAGAIGCGVVMLLISWPAALLSTAVMLTLQWYVGRRDVSDRWGEDVKHGAVYQRVRRYLLALEDEQYHPKNWRPSILALSGGAWSRQHLAVWGHWLSGSRGLLTLGQVIAGPTAEVLERRAPQEKLLRRYIAEHQLPAFPAVIVAHDVDTGVAALVQASGIGAMRPNLVLIGWSAAPERREAFASTLRTVAGLGRSLALVREQRTEDSDPWTPVEGTIDLWWRGHTNGALMLLLAHLLRLHPAWRGREIRILRMIGSDAGVEETTNHLEELCRTARIPATPLVLVGTDFRAVLTQASASAGVVFLGLLQPPEAGAAGYLEGLESLIAGLGTVIFVASARDMTLEA